MTAELWERRSVFSHQALEGQLADQQLRRFLVATELSQSQGPGACNGPERVAVRLLHAAGVRALLRQPWSPAASWGLCLRWIYETVIKLVKQRSTVM